MGAGGVIQQRAAIKTAVNDPAIFSALPPMCQSRVNSISSKGFNDWTSDETHFMASMLTVAVAC